MTDKLQRSLQKRARRELEEFALIKRRAKKLARSDHEKWQAALDREAALRQAMEQGDAEALAVALEDLTSYTDSALAGYRPNAAWELTKALFIAVAIALCLRWAFIEPFRIPSGSMVPTLLIGDQLMVNKLAFGPDYYVPYFDHDDTDEFLVKANQEGPYPIRVIKIFGHRLSLQSRKLWLRRLPERGEIVVFRYPHDPGQDYIKRVIALPGDTIEIDRGVIYINGAEQPKAETGAYTGPVGESFCENFDLYDETLMNTGHDRTHVLIHCLDNPYARTNSSFGPFEVPEGQLFMMGDNRDYSADSRTWGTASVNSLKGSALFIHLPLDPERNYLALRWDRLFKRIK